MRSMRCFRVRGPLTWRFVLCSVVAGLALAAALAFFVHYFVWPIQIVGGVERQFAWSEGVNTVAVRGADGGELYGLSGRCCAGDRGKVGDGRSRPGPAVVACYGEGVPFRYPVREGVSFTMGGYWRLVWVGRSLARLFASAALHGRLRGV